MQQIERNNILLVQEERRREREREEIYMNEWD